MASSPADGSLPSTSEWTLPRGPERDDRGLVMRVDGAEFRTRDQLSKLNRDRLSKKGLKPIEIATFDDIRSCNRDHLRTYCGVYEIKRKEKHEMELDMARYVAAWHYGEPGYNFADYTPAAKRPTFPGSGDKRPLPSSPSRSAKRVRSGGSTPSRRRGTSSAVDAPILQHTPIQPKLAAPVHPIHQVQHQPHAVHVIGQSHPGQEKIGHGVQSFPGQVHAAVRQPQRMVPVQAPRVVPHGTASMSAVASSNFKQYAHAQQAAARYKAAYNGGGAAIVQVVENAANYFEGNDNGETMLDKKKCLDRYQFNVDMLNQIFDGPPVPTEFGEMDTAASGAGTGLFADVLDEPKFTEDGFSLLEKPREVDLHSQIAHPSTVTNVLDDDVAEGDARRRGIADSMLNRLSEGMSSRTDYERIEALFDMDGDFEDLLSKDEGVDRMHVRALQGLDRAKTLDDVDRVRRDFERDHGIQFVDGANAVMKRELDLAAPLFVPQPQLRILKF